jgi:hypothetical protein
MYKILHLPTATYMYHSLNNDGKVNTRNFYTQHELDTGYYFFEEQKATQIFKTKSMATRFLNRWEWLATQEDNGNVDALFFEDNVEYAFKRCHFSIIKVKDV